MELRHLRYFAALAEHLNFTRAAESVHVTQSTLSHQTKQLEEELGHRLFDRIGKRVVITDAGERFHTYVIKALREVDDGIRAVRGSTKQLSGNLRIAATHTFNISLIPTCIVTFLKDHPSVRVTVEELSAGAVERAVAANSFDMGIAYRPNEAQEDITFEPLYNDEMALVVAPSHPFAGRKRLRMAELHRQNLILSTKETTTRKLLDEWFKSIKTEPVVVVEMNSIAPVLELVRTMDIAAVISRQALGGLEDLRIIPLENPTPMRSPGILWRRTSEPKLSAKSFAVTVRHAIVEAEMTRPS